MRFRRSCLWSLRYLAQDLNILLTAQRACQPDVSSETVGVGMRRGISDVRGPMVIGLVLVAVPALVLPASVSAVQPFPQIQRGHEISCSGPKAKVGVTVDWQKANRSGQHRGHAVGLIVGQNERVYSRKTASRCRKSLECPRRVTGCPSALGDPSWSPSFCARARSLPDTRTSDAELAEKGHEPEQPVGPWPLSGSSPSSLDEHQLSD